MQHKNKKFTVEVSEMLSRLVVVEAESIEEAREKVVQQYEDEEIVLTGDDHCSGSITVL